MHSIRDDNDEDQSQSSLMQEEFKGIRVTDLEVINERNSED